MSIKVTIEDSANGKVEVAVSSAYNPDILDDLRKRANQAYRSMLKDQVAAGYATEDEDAEDADALATEDGE